MKKMIKNSLVFMMLITSILTNANVLDTVRIINTNKITLLVLPNVEKGNILTVKDIEGVILYQEKIEDSGDYIKRFNLTTLPDGIYHFELNKGVEIRMIPFTLKSSKVTLNNASETVIHKPLLKTKGNLVYVSNTDLCKQDFQVEIYYNENNSYNLIHSETITENNLTRVYKLDKKEKGNYKIIITVKGKIFIDYFEF